MKRKRRKLAAIICALTLALSSAVPVSACTPPLKPPSVEIPDITFQPDDALKEAISNAAKNWILKCILASILCECNCSGNQRNAGTEKDPDQCGGTCSITDPDASDSGNFVHLLWNCN